MRLVGILNEQNDDRDALISEISKEVSCYYMQRGSLMPCAVCQEFCSQ